MPRCAHGRSVHASRRVLDKPTSFAANLFQTRIVFGAGKAGMLGDEADRMQIGRVMFVCTPGGANRYAPLVGALGDRCAVVFSEATPHSPEAIVQGALHTALSSKADATVCVGGGSTIGLGKFISVNAGCPQIAIPTTLSGSELTPIYGFKTNNEKRTGVTASAVPKVVIYDPELASSLPPYETAVSGMNSLAHSVEAFYVPNANCLADTLAGEGIKALVASLPDCVDQPGDVRARSASMYGGMIGGLLVAMVGLGLHHKICHVLGGHFGVAHGASNGVILPQVLAFNAAHMPAAMERISAAMNDADPAAACFRLAQRIGAPTGLRDVGVEPAGLDAAAKEIVSADVANPRATDFPSIRRLLEQAWHGTLP